jgi:hypothetical protein
MSGADYGLGTLFENLICPSTSGRAAIMVEDSAQPFLALDALREWQDRWVG